jgi:hypothetical protein
MPVADLQSVLKQAHALPPEQQRQLRDQLDVWLTHSSTAEQAADEEQIERQLLADKVIDHVPPQMGQADIEAYRRWRPIVVDGKPVSETILEERR